MVEEKNQSPDRRSALADSIGSEADKILDSPAFKRSAVLSRLLSYLVQKTIDGKSVKAIEIAIDCLGRSEKESVDSDNYARVVVARLRRALAQYYSTGIHERQLHIDPGSYAVRINSAVPTSLAEAKSVFGTKFNAESASKRILGLIALMLAALTILVWWQSLQSKAGRWAESNFPTVAVVAAFDNVVPDTDMCVQKMTTALSGYTGVKLLENPDHPVDFSVEFNSNGTIDDIPIVVRVIHRPTDRILWSQEFEADENCTEVGQFSDAAYAIASPGGLIESYSRRQPIDTNTPYGCWLQFTQSIKSYNSIGNKELEECSYNWFSSSPNHPVSALLYSWTLTDQAALKIRNSDRVQMLRQALEVATNASLVNTEFGSLHIARMRTLSFLGERQGVVTSARRAIETAQENPVIIGMAASGLALWNERDGERILRELRNKQSEHMPWEHVGLYIAAMMRDDVMDAGAQIEELSAYDQGQPVLRLLQAAYLARSGQRGEADAALHRLESDPRIWITGSDNVVDRLPLAPEVKGRLRDWIASDTTGLPDR